MGEKFEKCEKCGRTDRLKELGAGSTRKMCFTCAHVEIIMEKTGLSEEEAWRKYNQFMLENTIKAALIDSAQIIPVSEESFGELMRAVGGEKDEDEKPENLTIPDGATIN